MTLTLENPIRNTTHIDIDSTEIPHGFKITELGLIPKDWEIDSIINLASITTGSKNTQDNVQDGMYPFFVRSSTVQKINTYSFDGEAVLTAGDGVGTGKIFHYINGRFDFHQRVYKVSHFCEHLHGYFFYLYFSNYFYNRIMQMTAKSSVDSVRREMIADMLIPLPPLPQQRAIAAALSDIDSLINSLDQLIAKKRNIKLAAMQQLLTSKQRLPGFSDEWKKKQLAELGEFRGGSGFPLRYQGKREGDYPFFKVSDMNNSGNEMFMTGSNNYISERTRKNIGAIIFPENTIIFAKVGAAIFLERKRILAQTSCIDNNVMGFVLKDETINLNYLYYLFLSFSFGKLVCTTALPSLNGKEIGDLLHVFPSLSEQIAIADIFIDMDTEIFSLEQQLNKARNLKQGMMQELLTGRIRLK